MEVASGRCCANLKTTGVVKGPFSTAFSGSMWFLAPGRHPTNVKKGVPFPPPKLARQHARVSMRRTRGSWRASPCVLAGLFVGGRGAWEHCRPLVCPSSHLRTSTVISQPSSERSKEPGDRAELARSRAHRETFWMVRVLLVSEVLVAPPGFGGAWGCLFQRGSAVCLGIYL